MVGSNTHAHAQTAGRVISRDFTRTRGKVREAFGVDTHFDRMPVYLQIALREGQRQTCRNADLFTDQINTENTFSHRVFHLKACVHLDEIELSVFVKKLNGASARIPHLADGVCAD